MLDKRSVQNEDLYKKLEKETEDIVKKLKVDELRKANKELMNDIGDCFLSCMDLVEAIEAQDCMCIGLQI